MACLWQTQTCRGQPQVFCGALWRRALHAHGSSTVPFMLASVAAKTGSSEVLRQEKRRNPRAPLSNKQESVARSGRQRGRHARCARLLHPNSASLVVVSFQSALASAGVRLSSQGELVDADGSAINELGASRFDVATHGAPAGLACCTASCVCAVLLQLKELGR